MGNGSGISVMGYSAEDKSYTYREFNSWGEFTDSKGSLDGDTFTWVNDFKDGQHDQGTVHHEGCFAGILQLLLRSIAGR